VVAANVTRPGSTTVPVKTLFGIVRELNAGELDLSVDEKNICSVRSGSAFYRINGLAAEEFPPKQSLKEDKKVVFSQEKIRGMLKKTSFASSTDEARYVLNGIFLSFKEHKLTMVATDGRRLALVDEEADVTDKSAGDFIVPSKTVGELNRLLGDKGNVEILYGDNYVSFDLKPETTTEEAGGITIVSKLIEGNYPNYRQVIPPEAKERVPLMREEFLHALRRAEIMTSEKSNSVKLTFTKNRLEITANSPEVGEAKETLAINYQGKDLSIAFNPKYVLDPLNALANDEIFLELIDELSPGVIKINGPFLYVVMPMRLS
jgi:DNA polymerase-3 subunit beta